MAQQSDSSFGKIVSKSICTSTSRTFKLYFLNIQYVKLMRLTAAAMTTSAASSLTLFIYRFSVCFFFRVPTPIFRHQTIFVRKKSSRKRRQKMKYHADVKCNDLIIRSTACEFDNCLPFGQVTVQCPIIIKFVTWCSYWAGSLFSALEVFFF